MPHTREVIPTSKNTADGSVTDEKPAVSGNGRSSSRSARHLAPVQLRSRGLPGADMHKRGARCSNKGFLPISTADYLMLLDWTARLRSLTVQSLSNRSSTKRATTPKELVPVFVRLGISASTWFSLVESFGRLFSVVAGQPERVDSFRSRTHSQRFHMRRDARKLMAPG